MPSPAAPPPKAKQQSKIPDLRTENTRLRNENAALQKTSSSRRERIDTLEHQRSTLQVANEGLHRDIATTNARLERRNKELEDQKKHWMKKVRDVEREKEVLRMEIRRLEKRFWP
ncbi:MAG: hypothetical protein L6R38_005713 [Xanthoria sp. 2 TBL-2021]|nr:MAG: hypothetical protein L6R38_005713 [Xanthoria sp. 2 TBL-2021]